MILSRYDSEYIGSNPNDVGIKLIKSNPINIKPIIVIKTEIGDAINELKKVVMLAKAREYKIKRPKLKISV